MALTDQAKRLLVARMRALAEANGWQVVAVDERGELPEILLRPILTHPQTRAANVTPPAPRPLLTTRRRAN